MGASSIFLFGAAISLAIATSAFTAPAHADPAYTADKVINVFLKEKAAAKSYEAGKSRSVCIGTAEDCKNQRAEPPAPAQEHFDLLVNFEFNSDQLTQAAKENLNQFAKALQDPRLKGEKFDIDGHTDAVGAEEYNQDLSERRAKAVVSYLASQGLDPTLLIPKGFGKSKPRVADPYSGENRRVETHLQE
jgi:outer membrane protein OmpA-like peptidoglycan-associated protein